MTPASTKLSDGQALDRLADQAERWARTWRDIDDEAKLRGAFTDKFQRDAEQLAAECTPKARAFEVKDWIMAVLLWLIMGGGVLLASILLMRPDALWFWVFVGVAVAVFVIGLGYVYRDTTSEAAAARKLEKKTQWLLGASLRTAEQVVRERRANREA